MQVCLLEVQEMAPPQSKNTQTLVFEWSSKYEIQIAFEYPSRTKEYPK